ncbi:MAG: BMC domain-containing protein [Ignavibacteriaceae bacterium]|jgi:microcompartment protein CcmL/EutN|nr:BMC domain-containing protein [Ignavibacteriaceae bacterium]
MNSLGLIEMTSIAAGMQAADIMLKTSNVEMILSRTICSGKYMTLIGGEVAAVQTAVDAAVETINFGVIDHFVIPNVHPDIFPAIAGHTGVQLLESLGIIESFSVASLIEAADAAVKAASVKLIEVRLAMALGGKAFVTMTGEVAAVTAAVEAGAALVSEKGLLVNKVIIAQPRQELLNEMI